MKNQETPSSTSSETALTTKQDAATATTGVEGLEDWPTSKLIPPRLALMQPINASKHDAQPGTFRDISTGECRESIVVVPLRLKWGRVYFDRESDDLVCRSNDGLVPSDGVESPPAQACEFCSYSKWQGKRKPGCAETVNALFVDVDKGRAFQITFKGKSLKPVQFLASWFAGQQMPLFSHSCTMRTKHVTGRYNYFVVEFVDYTPVDPADKYRPLYLQLKGFNEDDAREAAKDSSVGDDDIPF